jgi:phosphatidylglycerol:prolipoprotein diacylglycerol transferase
MYPYKIIFDLTLYDILICVGIVAAFMIFGFLADKGKIKVKHQKLAIVCGCVGIAIGLVSASFFQALYNIPQRGGFEFLFKITEEGKIELVNTGITFYGGVIGGVAAFLLVYFIAGIFVYRKTDTPLYHKERFFSVASAAMPALTFAHSLGRIGCLTAGCCHGAPTDAWYGIVMHVGGTTQKYVPTQLFEAIFLLILAAFLFVNALEGKKYNLPLYMSIYGVWRFIIEFLRDDYRGSVGIDALTPSQLIAIIMIVGAIGVFFLERWYSRKLDERYPNGLPWIVESLSEDAEKAEEGENNN